MVGVNHIWSPVIEETNYKNVIDPGSLLNSTRTNYIVWNNNANQIYPSIIDTKKGTDVYQQRLQYLRYDNATGNLQSVSKVSGSSDSYVWGYNGLYPIAQISGADYATVETVLGGSAAVQTFRDNPSPTDADVSSFLAPLRSDVRLKDALITTYTYQPLVGMTSMTDAKGEVTTYEYDAFQRLVTVRDHNGNIVKHTDYHYQNQ
jgi:YD repeat-containing protein